MPEGPRMLDFRALPNNEGPTHLEKTLSQFSQRLDENRTAQRESDALEQIYKQYQGDQQNIIGQTQAIQKDVNLGPSAKVNAINQLIEASKYNQQRTAEVEKKLKEQRERQAALNAKVDPDLPAALQKSQYEANIANQQAQEILNNQGVQQENQAPNSNPQANQVSGIDWSKLTDNQLIQLQGVKGYKDQAEAEQTRRQEKAKLGDERSKEIGKAQAKADFDFVQSQVEKIPELFNRQKTMDAAEQLNNEGVTGSNWDQAMQLAGLLQYTSDGYRQFATYAKDAVKNQNIKAIIGSQISQLEFGFFRDATISERFSKEANNQIIKKEKAAIRYEKLYADITEKMVQENQGDIPSQIQNKVNKEFAQQSKKITQEVKEAALDFEAIQNVPKGKVLMYDKNRRPLHVPANEVEKYSKPPYGASLS